MGFHETASCAMLSSAMNAPSLTIPTVDLDDLRSGEPDRLERAAAALLEGFGTYGLVYVANHGVANPSALYDDFGAFCAQPHDRKQPYNRADLWYQRGWTPPNTEKAVVASGQPDFKECWFAAPLEVDAESKAEFPELACDNLWPEGDADFERRYLTLGRELHAAGLELLRGAARALKLEPETFSSVCEGGPHVLRLLRYLPLDQAQIDAKVLWGEEHTDFNLITLLPGGRFHAPDGPVGTPPDGSSGLYLRTRPTEEHPDGIVVRGSAPTGCIVAQVGQQLEMLTGGAFLATPHVVTAPRSPGWSRFSAAHFVHAHSRTVLAPLRSFRTPSALAAYSPPVLAGTYAIKTLVDIGLAPPEALGKLGYRHYERLATIRAAEDAAPRTT
jgi:isopenicillin N synthase-like dioxygenase